MNETNLQLSTTLTFNPTDSSRLARLCGQRNDHLKQIGNGLGVKLHNRGSSFHIRGTAEAIQTARSLLQKLYLKLDRDKELSAEDIHLELHGSSDAGQWQTEADPNGNTAIDLRNIKIEARSANQAQYIDAIRNHDINFGIGPAGTGKTHLAVACAIEALRNYRVRRIVLTRPAVEAGEHLGFLPGDLNQKIDPYLQPLYDALYQLLDKGKTERLISRSVIEVAPLAYMRGRTLSNAFVILDEAQNTTPGQMKMLLTRIGFDSVAVINGDLTQTDLPGKQVSGLQTSIDRLQGLTGISFSYLDSDDIIRHPLIKKILNAWQKPERRSPPGNTVHGAETDRQSPAVAAASTDR